MAGWLQTGRAMSNFMAAGWVASAAPKTKTQKLKKTIGELSFALSL